MTLVGVTPKPSQLAQTETSTPIHSEIHLERQEPASLAPKVYPRFNLRQVLKDKEQRISEEFKIPKSMYWRVSFWYQVYTQHNSHVKLVHHKKYPWIIFDTIDANFIYEENSHRFTKYHKEKSFTQKRRRKVWQALNKLSKRKNYRNLSGLERKIYRLLKQIPGKRHAVIREAFRNIRTQTGQKDHYLAGLERGSRYFSALEKHFEEEGLPRELTRLPLVESSFNTKAISKVGASGVWQIMPYIGKKFLHIGKNIDERNSPFKATKVAAALLKENHFLMKKNWPLAVTAYNHGTGGLRKVMRKTKTNDLAKMISRSRTKKFGFASKNFYACFLAAIYADRYQNEIFAQDQLKKQDPMRYDIYQLTADTQITPKGIAELAGIELKKLIEYNYDLKKAAQKNTAVSKNYRFYLPEGKAITFANNLNRLERLKSKLEWMAKEPQLKSSENKGLLAMLKQNQQYR